MDHLGLLLDRIKPGDTVHFVFLHINPKDRTASRVDMTLTLAKATN